MLQQDPNSPGSLGIAISEAVEDAATRDDTKYALGSVLNHVLMHQTVVGLEVKKQLEKADAEADILVGCIGGGSNFAGFSFPFVADKLAGKNKKLRVVAVEPSACPSLTKGKYVYDFGDTVGLTPLVKMYTLGHTFIPPSLPRHGARDLQALRREGPRGDRRAPGGHLPGRRAVRSDGGHPAGARGGPRRARCHRRGAPVPEGRQAEDDRLQPVRPRLPRPLRLRGVPCRQAPGLRVPGGEGRRGAQAAAEGQGVEESRE